MIPKKNRISRLTGNNNDYEDELCKKLQIKLI